MSSYDEIPDELVEYIVVRINGYLVKKGSFDGGTTFGSFNSLKEACAAACILCKNNWKLMDVINDPLVNYGGEFWVFKVEKNKLVLDNKFDDYESAVEYMEINFRCNDYHNDIFRNSLKKKGYKSRYESSISEKGENDKNKYIFEVSDKFLVKKSTRKDAVCYGEFNSLDEAIAARKLLVDSHWNITSEHEISFYNNFYWIFEVSEGILTFKGKSQSYEDALDMINPPKSQKESENIYIKSIDENYENFIKKKKSIKRKYKPINGNGKYNEKTHLKVKNNVDITRIWDAPYKKPKQDNTHIRIFAINCGETPKNLFILDFDFVFDKILCLVDGVEIKWGDRNNVKINNFPEFRLILRILESNGWDFSKIKYSSSIHFENPYYYKINFINNNTFVFNSFSSYRVAEKSRLRCKRIKKKKLDIPIPMDIDKFDKKYELVKFKDGEIYNVNRSKSLEEVKAIRDIMVHSEWNFNIFDNYDLFYLNGFYWELTCKDHIIYLIDRFESIDISN